MMTKTGDVDPSSEFDVDVLCIGESMVVLAPLDASALDVGSTLGLSVGGAESNVAVGVRALGHPVAWAGLLGDDRFGDLVEAELRGRGVRTGLVERRPARTGLYVKSPGPDGTTPLYYRSDSAATHMDAAAARRWATSISPRIVHVSGITAQISAGGREFLRAICVDRVFGEATVSFDVNHRPSLASADTPVELAELCRRADIVFVGADEAARLWGLRETELPDHLGRPPHLVVKDAASHAAEFVEGERVECPTPPVEVVEPVGAGDAFAAGWLAAYLDGHPAIERLAAGHAAAARVLMSATDLPLSTNGADT